GGGMATQLWRNGRGAGRLLAVLASAGWILLSAPAAVAADPVTLSGVVRDGSGQPLPNVQVVLAAVPPATVQSSTVSAADGSYSLTVAPGTYRLNMHGFTALSFLLTGSSSIDLSSSRVQDLTLPVVDLTVYVADSGGAPVPSASLSVNGSAVGVTLFPGYVMS